MHTFKGTTGTLYFRPIEKKMRDEFHAACAKRGKSMIGVIKQLMTEFIDKMNNYEKEVKDEIEKTRANKKYYWKRKAKREAKYGSQAEAVRVIEATKAKKKKAKK